MNPYAKRFIQEIERDAWLNQLPFHRDIAEIYDLMFENSQALSPSVVTDFQRKASLFKQAVAAFPGELKNVFDDVKVVLGIPLDSDIPPSDLFPETLSLLDNAGKTLEEGQAPFDLFLENMTIEGAVTLLSILTDANRRAELVSVHTAFQKEEALKIQERRSKMTAVAQVLLGVLREKAAKAEQATPTP